MTDYDINDLRDDLRDTIRALRTGDEKMTVEKAKVIGELAQTVINSAKVEVDLLRVVGRRNLNPTGFIKLVPAGDSLDAQEGRPLAQLDGPKQKPHVYNPMGSFPKAAL